jgi:hypothetical protein
MLLGSIKLVKGAKAPFVIVRSMPLVKGVKTLFATARRGRDGVKLGASAVSSGRLVLDRAPPSEILYIAMSYTYKVAKTVHFFPKILYIGSTRYTLFRTPPA